MITVIGGIKGGGGKTTIATNLCVLRASEKNNKVLFVDSDEQRTASDWACLRQSKGIETNWTTIQLNDKAIISEIKKMINNYDDIIIDVGGRETSSQRAALCIAHQCIIPFKPKSFDMWTLGLIKTLISEAKIFNPCLKSYALINQADSRGSDNDEAIDIMKDDEEFIYLPTPIGYRKAFANAASEGLGVVELKKIDAKANEEIQSLYRCIFNP